MSNKLKKNIGWFVLSIAIILLIINLFGLFNIQVNTTTVLLLIIILISPFINQITKIKFGDFEAEISPSEIDKVRKEIESNGIKKIRKVGKSQSLEEDLMDLSEKDNILALAKLRMELEKVLRKLCFKTLPQKQKFNRAGIAQMINALVNAEILPRRISTALYDVSSIANRAIHGEAIRTSDSKMMIELGIQLLNEIEAIYEDKINPTVKSSIIAQDEMKQYLDAKYKVITIIPTIPEPKKNTYIFTQNELDAFLEGYNEYAEFLVSIEKVK
jgi:hypothetical protein